MVWLQTLPPNLQVIVAIQPDGAKTRMECISKYFTGLWYRSNQLFSVPVRLSQSNAAKLVWLTRGQTSKSTRLPVDSFQLFPGFAH